jgi:hypothetical protein
MRRIPRGCGEREHARGAIALDAVRGACAAPCGARRLASDAAVVRSGAAVAMLGATLVVTVAREAARGA